MTMLPIFKSTQDTEYIEEQKRRQHMLKTMIQDGLPFFDSNNQDFEKVIRRMSYTSVANALEECTIEEIAGFLKLLGVILEEDY